jgi:hypothetical protein
VRNHVYKFACVVQLLDFWDHFIRLLNMLWDTVGKYLRIFVSMFIRGIDLQFSFMDASSFGIKIILASKNV